jgi:hypothetical protein
MEADIGQAALHGKDTDGNAAGSKIKRAKTFLASTSISSTWLANALGEAETLQREPPNIVPVQETGDKRNAS